MTKVQSPVGTAEKVTKVIRENSNVEFDVVSNPEFLREGFAVEDFMKPERVVVGTSSEKAKKLMEELYQPFVRQGILYYLWMKNQLSLLNMLPILFSLQKLLYERDCQLLRNDWCRCGYG